MARAYFIGGAPRVGKSSLALKLQERHHLPCASTDSLRAQLRQSIRPEDQPDLFYLDTLNADEANMARLMREHTSELIASADRESAAVWPAIKDFVSSNLIAGRDVLVEGVAILPPLVAQLDIDYSVVYLGNQSPSHAQIIQDYAKSHPDTWLGSLQPDTVAAFAQFSRAYSNHISQHAALFNQPYLEMSDQSFSKGLGLALTTLMPHSN